MTLHRLRSRKSIALVCVGLILVAACLPFDAALFTAILTPLWMVIPAVVVRLIRERATRSDEQPVSLLAHLPSRAPPPVLTFA